MAEAAARLDRLSAVPAAQPWTWGPRSVSRPRLALCEPKQGSALHEREGIFSCLGLPACEQNVGPSMVGWLHGNRMRLCPQSMAPSIVVGCTKCWGCPSLGAGDASGGRIFLSASPSSAAGLGAPMWYPRRGISSCTLAFCGCTHHRIAEWSEAHGSACIRSSGVGALPCGMRADHGTVPLCHS